MRMNSDGDRFTTAVLVEGESDRLALEALARRLGRDLAAERVAVLPMGGSKNVGKFLERFGPRGLDLKLAGMCDAGEEGDFRRGLEEAGLGVDLTRSHMERLGFVVCVRVLEDELIRSLGSASVERVIAEQGESAPWRTFQNQPQWRGRPVHDQLRRFIGTHSGRKALAATAFVEALDLGRVPRPLEALLAFA